MKRPSCSRDRFEGSWSPQQGSTTLLGRRPVPESEDLEVPLAYSTLSRGKIRRSVVHADTGRQRLSQPIAALYSSIALALHLLPTRTEALVHLAAQSPPTDVAEADAQAQAQTGTDSGRACWAILELP